MTVKKQFLFIFTILLIATCNMFGYFKSDNFIDFLIHKNQLRVRLDRVGFLAGPSNIRVALGATGAENMADIILNNLGDAGSGNENLNRLIPAVLGGVGYKNDIFGIGVGYEYLWKSESYMVHTPVITSVALDDNFRINIPVSIGVGVKSKKTSENLDGTMVLSTAIEARYYFNTDLLSHIRLYFNYGNAKIANITNKSQYFVQQSIGGQIRVYFNVETPNVLIEPIFRVQFDQSLKTQFNLGDEISTGGIVDSFTISAKGFTPSDPGSTGAGGGTSGGANADPNSTLQGGYIAGIPKTYYAKEPYRFAVAIPVGFSATSADENMHFYFEPAISFTMINAKDIFWASDRTKKRKSPFYTFGYVVYGELYLRPVPQLEWYFEVQTGGATVAGDLANASSTYLVFNGSTGITWYF